MSSNTPRIGLPYPDGTDLLMSGNEAIQALAEALDDLQWIQAGSVAWPGAAAGANASVNVVFTDAFAAAPIVVGVLSDSRVIVAPSNITTAGFTFNGRNMSAGAVGAGTGYWLAFGQIA